MKWMRSLFDTSFTVSRLSFNNYLSISDLSYKKSIRYKNLLNSIRSYRLVIPIGDSMEPTINGNRDILLVKQVETNGDIEKLKEDDVVLISLERISGKDNNSFIPIQSQSNNQENQEDDVIKDNLNHEYDNTTIIKMNNGKKITPHEDDTTTMLLCKRIKQIIILSDTKKQFWVEGDNTKQSFDSNHFGPLTSNYITAKALAIIWPLTRIKML